MTTATKTAITMKEARELMVRAVEERGADYVYQQHEDHTTGPLCRYQREDGTPDCLIGLMLSYIGPIPANKAGSARYVVGGMYPDTSEFVLRALAEAQVEQDRGYTWGEALEKFNYFAGFGD